MRKRSSSSSDDEDASSSGGESEQSYEQETRAWQQLGAREAALDADRASGALQAAKDMFVDDLSSDDEEAGNATGRVPLHWYEGYDHVGYGLEGSKVIAEAPRDALDLALEASEGGGLTVYDRLNGRNVHITARELEQIRRMKGGAFANPESEMYGDFSIPSKVEKTPMSGAPEPKRRFLPSKWEGMRVHRLAQGLAEGRLRTRAENKKRLDEERDPERAFLAAAESMWSKAPEDDEGKHSGPMHIPAPKAPLPGHEESYNPPQEYLVDDDGEPLVASDDEFQPKGHEALRHVGAYEHAVKERFERCLDLYLCPRAFKRRLDIDPESLVPKLPDPRDLKPFPNALSRDFLGHAAPVHALDVSPDGQWLATGDGAGALVVWEVFTGRRAFSGELPGPILSLAWNPNREHHVVAVAARDGVYILDTGTARGDDADVTKQLLAGPDAGAAPEEPRVMDAADEDTEDSDDGSSPKAPAPTGSVATWTDVEVGGRRAAKAALSSPPHRVSWHRRGDYVVSVAPDAAPSRQVVVHRCTRRDSQAPLRRGDRGGQVQCAAFHPSKPFLFVATRTTVRVYHLAEQKLAKTLRSGAKWISCLDVHPSGDHVVVGTRDRRLCWFDLDLGEGAHRTLKYHDKMLRGAHFHPTYPLLATAGDDGRAHVFHARVYDDLSTNALIVPVKILEAHAVTQGMGALCLKFHPTQPWLFTAGGDGRVQLFHNL
mmetsp:Transcript_12698/g.37767  ORF Transcript_12698/g.37767 Transcript_12698/m.37767 type:complete len:715 (-) Transcript_12698:27-2171(-)